MSWTYASTSLSSLPAKAGNPARRRLLARAPACLECRAMTTSGRHYALAPLGSGPLLRRADVAQEGVDVGPQPLGFAAQRRRKNNSFLGVWVPGSRPGRQSFKLRPLTPQPILLIVSHVTTHHLRR